MNFCRDNLDWDSWSCDLERRQGEISDLMQSNPNMRDHYKTAVPELASHKQFWTRYFFKVHLIELQEAKRQAMKKKAEQRLESDAGARRLSSIMYSVQMRAESAFLGARPENGPFLLSLLTKRVRNLSRSCRLACFAWPRKCRPSNSDTKSTPRSFTSVKYVRPAP